MKKILIIVCCLLFPIVAIAALQTQSFTDYVKTFPKANQAQLKNLQLVGLQNGNMVYQPYTTASGVSGNTVNNYNTTIGTNPNGLYLSNQQLNLSVATDTQAGAISATDHAKITALKSAANKDVPTTGNASASQVVMGNDTRLSDSRPASDVSLWAKATTKPSYTYSEVGAASAAQGTKADSALQPGDVYSKVQVDSSLALKQNSLGYTAENLANKSTNIALGTSDVLYPTQNAVKTYVDNHSSSGGISDAPNDGNEYARKNAGWIIANPETQATIKSKLGAATDAQDGYLSQTDHANFNSKISPPTLSSTLMGWVNGAWSSVRSALDTVYHGITVTWAEITGKPTTLAGYGITDPVMTTNSNVVFGQLSTALKNNALTGPGYNSNTADGTHFVQPYNSTACPSTCNGKSCEGALCTLADGKTYQYHTNAWNLLTSGTSGNGTVTSIAVTSPLTGGTITNSGTIGIQQANNSQPGYLSNTDWSTFNSRLNPTNNLSDVSNPNTALSNLGGVAQVGNQDIEITDATKGVILKSSGGNRYRIAVADNGTLSTALVNAVIFAPNMPTGLSATGGSLQNTVSWSASTVDASHSAPTSYDVLWGTSSGGESNTLLGVTSPYNHTGLSASTTYYYKVRANNSVGSATSSTEVSASTSGVVYAPNAPAGATAVAGANQNTISWSAGNVDGTHSAPASYNLLWGTSSGGESNTIASVSSPYVHSSLTNGTAYYYKVRAINSAGNADSSEFSSTPGIPGLLDFESTSLTPNTYSTAYTNDNATNATRSTTVAHAGSYSMKFIASTSAPYPQLYRNVTLPASGDYTFVRYFQVSAQGNTSSDFVLFAVAPDNTPSAWGPLVQYYDSTGALGGVRYANSGSYYNLYPYSSMSANTWYKISITLHCSTNTYDVSLYNNSGTQLASATGKTGFSAMTFNGSRYIYEGRSTVSGAPTYYMDDFNDGI